MPVEGEMDTDIAYIGDEDLNEEAVALINRLLRDDELPVAVAGFDYEMKVIAMTGQRVIIASGDEGLVLELLYDDIDLIGRDGRTLVIRTRHGDEHRHRFGKDDTVQELVEIARRQRHPEGSRPAGAASPAENPAAKEERAENEKPPHIAERVRFWEEQDRINQELIPRVIRQHELLTKHISDHEMLPVVAAAAARVAIEQAQTETLRQLEEARTLNQELANQLEQASTEREDQKRQHLEELSKLKRERRTPWVLAGVACAVAAVAIILAFVI